MKKLEHLSEISDQYDTYIIDLWGVMHNGIQLNVPAIKAVERVDTAIGNIKDALDESKSIMLLTADHGNCEIMLDSNTQIPHTSHTCNKVPLIIISPGGHFKLKDGKLADIAPTILEIMSLDIPVAMNGKSLLVK